MKLLNLHRALGAGQVTATQAALVQTGHAFQVGITRLDGDAGLERDDVPVGDVVVDRRFDGRTQRGSRQQQRAHQGGGDDGKVNHACEPGGRGRSTRHCEDGRVLELADPQDRYFRIHFENVSGGWPLYIFFLLLFLSASEPQNLRALERRVFLRTEDTQL